MLEIDRRSGDAETEAADGVTARSVVARGDHGRIRWRDQPMGSRSRQPRAARRPAACAEMTQILTAKSMKVTVVLDSAEVARLEAPGSRALLSLFGCPIGA